MSNLIRWASSTGSSHCQICGESGDVPHWVGSVNDAVTVGAQNGKVLERRCLAASAQAERLRMVDLAEASADFAIDHGEIEAACFTYKSSGGAQYIGLFCCREGGVAFTD